MTTKREKSLKAFWVGQEARFGLAIPQDFRHPIERELFSIHHDDEVDFKDLEDQLPFYIEIAMSSLNAIVERNNAKDVTGKESTSKRYQKCFERRLRIVTFVSDRMLGISEWNDGTIKPKRRISWKRICAEWNREYPFDTMNPGVLKVEYFRARSEDDIQKEYYFSKHNDLQPDLVRLAKAFRSLAPQIVKMVPELLQAVRDKQATIPQLVKMFPEILQYAREMQSSAKSLLKDRLNSSAKRKLSTGSND